MSLIKRLSTRRLIEFSFFAALLAVGLAIYRDYGLHWDSFSQTYVGEINYRYIANGDTALLGFKNRYYGPAFEIFLYLITRVLSERDLFFTRHLFIFLSFFLGVIIFYRLANKLLGNWKLALFGCALLIFSPRIFADSFYNSKDIPFLSAFILSVFTMIRFLERKTVGSAVFHGFTSALLVALRLPGLLIPGLTAGLFALDSILSPAGARKRSWFN